MQSPLSPDILALGSLLERQSDRLQVKPQGRTWLAHQDNARASPSQGVVSASD